jgi:hydroxypyruvate isomerase
VGGVPALRYAANVSILFPDRPVEAGLRAAARAGFDAVESWWPFPAAVPGDAEVDAFVTAVQDAGVRLVQLNFPAGDMGAGDRGLLSLPGRSAEFRDGVAVAVGIAERLGCRLFNAVYGNRVDGLDPEAQDDLAVDNLAHAGRAAGRIGGRLLVEPLSGAPRYPLRTAADAVAVIDRVARATGVTDLGLLCDVYHLAVNGDDVEAVIDTLTPRVAHVQVADAPGRGAPGTGTLPLERWLDRLAAAGYRGWVSLEYHPGGADPFGWLPQPSRRTS